MIILCGQWAARRYLQQQTPLWREQALCLVITGSKLESVAEEYRLRQWRSPAWSAVQQERHLRDYLAIMDQLALANGANPLWWSAHLARKNMTNSPLPALLQQFALAMQAAEAAQGQRTPLVVLGLSWPVVALLRGRASVVRGGWWQQWRFHWGGRWRAVAELLTEAVYTVRRILLFRGRAFWRAGTEQTESEPRFLIKSFAYGRSFSGNGFQDPFFGAMGGFLNQEAGRVLTMVLVAEQPRLCYQKMAGMADLLPVERFLRLLEVVRETMALLTASHTFTCRGDERFLGQEVGPLLDALLQAGGWRLSLYQYLHFHAGQRLARHYPLSGLLYPFEGNLWERAFLAGIRSVQPGVPAIGYQHSVVSREHASMFLTPNELRLAPDVVVTNGTVTAAMLGRYGALPTERVRVGCALRYGYLHQQQEAQAWSGGEPLLVLVPLEGLLEVAPMVAYLLDQAPLLPLVRFRLRAHPVLPVATILAHLGRTLPEGGQIEISTATCVADDLADCGPVLYSRTTVALEALWSGKPVIHFDSGGLFGEDPLFELEAFKWQVARDQPLAPILAAILAMSQPQRDHHYQIAKVYLRRYFLPQSPATLAPFLPDGLRSRQG